MNRHSSCSSVRNNCRCGDGTCFSCSSGNTVIKDPERIFPNIKNRLNADWVYGTVSWYNSYTGFGEISYKDSTGYDKHIKTKGIFFIKIPHTSVEIVGKDCCFDVYKDEQENVLIAMNVNVFSAKSETSEKLIIRGIDTAYYYNNEPQITQKLVLLNRHRKDD